MSYTDMLFLKKKKNGSCTFGTSEGHMNPIPMLGACIGHDYLQGKNEELEQQRM